MRAVHIDNGVVVNVLVVDELSDGFIESETANIGDFYDGEVFTAPTVMSTQVPNVNGFMQSVKEILGGIVSANALAVAYPLFFTAVQMSEWSDVQALIEDAKVKGLITDSQFFLIMTAAESNSIPLNL
jgi:hypothetical protein